MPFIHRPLSVSVGDVPPVDARASLDGTWHALFPRGEIVVASPEGGLLRRFNLDLSGLNPDNALTLRVAPDGRLAAVAEEFGLRGRVFDLTNGQPLLPLERGDYHANFSAFPLAFASHAGRSVLVHGTDWNRLDITDPMTGEVLTPRAPTEYRRGEDEPEHYLDYFHGRLHPSPDGTRIAEDGWVWHPIGVPRVWSFSRWLTENVWESEDGPSLVELPARFYFWDGPMTWIDDRRLALWGLGRDEEELEPGIRIFDPISGEEIQTFPGPSVAPFKVQQGGGERKGWIACDRWLYAVSPEDESLSVWDVESGECLHREPVFTPLAHHRESEKFLSWREGTLVLSRFHE